MNYITLEELATQELEAGIKKALENAGGLIEEGDLLFQHNCFQRAYTLYQLATEEVGKSRLLFTIIMDRNLGNEINYKETNWEFRHHQTKSQSAIVFEAAALLIMHSSGKESMEERKKQFLEAYEELQAESAEIDTLNDNKNNSLYVGIIDNKFVSPAELVTKDMAGELRTKAIIRLEAGKSILQGILQDLNKLVNLMKAAKADKENKTGEQFFNVFFK